MPDRFESETYADPLRWNRRRREQLAEPFYSTEPPCVDCGHPLSKCACGIPDEPVCPDLYPQLVAARNVREIHTICQAHRLVCAACGDGRRPIASETALRDRAERRAA